MAFQSTLVGMIAQLTWQPVRWSWLAGALIALPLAGLRAQAPIPAPTPIEASLPEEAEPAPADADEPPAPGDPRQPGNLPERLMEYSFQFNEFEAGQNYAKLLQGREWTDLTEIDVLLDDSRREEVREILQNAYDKDDLRFIVVTIKADKIREFLPTVAALMQERLALDEGGVIVCTDAAGSQITGYTTLLETRVGKNALRLVDKRALANSTLAVGPSERAVSLVRTVTEELAAIKRSLESGSLSSAEKLFAPSADVILGSESEARRALTATATEEKPPAPEDTPATGTPGEADRVNPGTGAVGAAPYTPPPNTSSTTSAVSPGPGYLGPFLAGMGALLVLIAAGLVTRLAVGAIRRKRRRRPVPDMGASTLEPIAPKTTPAAAPETPATESPATPEPAADGSTPAPPASTAASTPTGLKPRQFEKGRAKRRGGSGSGGTPVREDLREWVDNLERLGEAYRPTGAPDYFNPDTDLNPVTMGEIHMHYRALFRMLPANSRQQLTESLESLLEEVRNAPASGKTEY